MTRHDCLPTCANDILTGAQEVDDCYCGTKGTKGLKIDVRSGGGTLELTLQL